MKNKSLFILIATGLLLVALSKVLIPSDLVNFSPIGAIALMGGAFMGRRVWTFLLPIAAVFMADIMISGQAPIYSSYLFSSGMLFVYLGFLAIAGLGILFKNKLSIAGVFGSSILAAVIFFILSNFGSWIFLPEYTKDMSGLATCYANAIPYFRNTLVSQVLFSFILYFGWSLSFNKKLAWIKIPG
ncbi:hypothetical protein GYB22_02435 [bacterium]|nr:hypothetical protein [bacterium]